MSVIDDYKKGLNSVLHPQMNTSTKMSVQDTLKMYYMFSIIPVVLFIVLGAIAASLAGALLAHYLPSLGMLGALGGGTLVVAVIVSVIVDFWIAVPIGILIGAALYQLVGGVIFKWFKGGYAGSVTAVAYSAMAVVGVAWLSVIPIIGSIIVLLFSIWSIYVLIAALSNQHQTTKGKAFMVWLIWVIIGVIIFGFAVFSIFSHLGSIPATSIIPAEG